MPENKTRHTCAVCRVKRYEEFMEIVGYYGQGAVWACSDKVHYKRGFYKPVCAFHYERPPYVLPPESIQSLTLGN